MEGEDNLLPISALQHLVFCPRQCALIHLERVWAENRLTVEGDLLHARVQEGETTTRGVLRTHRSLPLVNRRLGLSGYADVVEIVRQVAPHAGAWIGTLATGWIFARPCWSPLTRGRGLEQHHRHQRG